ncbi:hypothetical protein PS941_01691 [Pseudomonas fluorescens]|uniref:Uncharacterized protein n=1 Tax=Pseudomonas fluorescens TaxID=294 RepID=A0A5E7SXK8_PSEFL|nr:hypothetical protein PS941_01691 [Pseudomonas fluorescens]
MCGRETQPGEEALTLALSQRERGLTALLAQMTPT